jgi:hypothetical protein
MPLLTVQTPFTANEIARFPISNNDGVGFTLNDPGTYSLVCSVPWYYHASDSQALAAMTAVGAGEVVTIVVTSTPVTRYCKANLGPNTAPLRISYDQLNPEDIRVLAEVSLTDAATIATNADLGDIFKVTLGGNRTMAAPTNPAAGKRITYRLTQDGTGSRTITWNAAFRFSTDIPEPTLSTDADATDYVVFVYNADASTWDCLGVNCGFAA